MSSADYPNATWYGAYKGNYTSANRPDSHEIDKIIVHVVQGSFSSAINWFNDSRAGVSAHYTVRSSDGFVGQSVHDRDLAYHAGYWPHNQTSIGIEHEGFVSDPSWFTDEMYRSSAQLSAYLCRRYGIPADRQHIIGHHEVPGCAGEGGGAGCHTDPGRNWDWQKYMNLINGFLKHRQVIDNANGRRFRASGDWGTSSYSSQKLGADYRFTRPAAVNDPAFFKVEIPRKGEYDIFARWPANSAYNSDATFMIRTSDGWVRRVRDQTRDGGRWNRLGRFPMDAGDTWSVRLARRSPAEGYVIADGLFVREV